MTVMEFFGCTLIAFGPPLSIFCLVIAKDAIRIIILISSSFFWLLSLLLSSILWSSVVPLKDVLIFGVSFSIVFQEVFRYLFYILIRKAENGLQKVSEVGVGVDGASNISNTRSQLALVSGFGFGLMSGAFSLTNMLADSVGPGTVGLKGDSHYFFLCSALTTLAFILLHTFWGIIFFKACDNRNYYLIAYVIITHIMASGITFINKSQMYALSIVLVYLVTMVTSIVAFYSAGGNYNTFKKVFRSRL